MKWIPPAVLSLVLLSACGSAEPEVSGSLDQKAQWACDDLAYYMADGANANDREQVLNDIAANAKASDVTAIASAGQNLEALAGLDGWESGADVLAAACMAEGWEIS